VCGADCFTLPDFTGCVENAGYVSPFFTTSQIGCYSNTELMACPSTGDFYGQEPQFNYMQHNFIENDNTVEDAVSGLMWQKTTPSIYGVCKEPPCSVLEDYSLDCLSGTSCTIEEAENYCGNLDIGGFYDWRLPTEKEFSTIINFAQPSSLLYSYFDIVSGNYWTSDSVLVSVDSGIFTASTTGEAFVKCVRSETPTCEQCSQQMISPVGNLYYFGFFESQSVLWYYDELKSATTWQSALADCSAISENGLTNWRLPTVNELPSLVNRTELTALIPGLSGAFWTSTTVHALPDEAYAVDFTTGNVTKAVKTTNALVICIK